MNSDKYVENKEQVECMDEGPVKLLELTQYELHVLGALLGNRKHCLHSTDERIISRIQTKVRKVFLSTTHVVKKN